MREADVWYGNGLKERALRVALIPLSWLYALGWQGYLAVYRLGLKHAAEPHRPVLCVGNLVVGGSGKTPLTLHLARVLCELGHEVVIGCSAYGSPSSEAASLAPGGPLDPAKYGDEPAMYRWFLPDVPIIVGRRRALAAQICHENFPNSVLLMDDGFQHLPVKKHITIVLDDMNPANSHCLPAGPYREPQSNRRRADLVLPGKFRIGRTTMRLETTEGETANPQAFSVLCALGQPERFLAQLPEATIKEKVLMPDHDPLTGGTLLNRLPADLPVVVTAKDWVKIRERGDVGTRTWLIARQDVTVEAEGEFRAWLKARLDECSAESSNR